LRRNPSGMLKGEFDGLVVPNMSSILGFVVVLMMIGLAVGVFVGIDVGPDTGILHKARGRGACRRNQCRWYRRTVSDNWADGSIDSGSCREVFAWTVVCSVPGGSLGW
jgi:hypothetical protein